jgi:hypothetical protein
MTCIKWVTIVCSLVAIAINVHTLLRLRRMSKRLPPRQK